MELLSVLPEETWITILSYLNPEEDYLAVACSCSFFHRMLDDNSLWKRYFATRFGILAPPRPIYDTTQDWKAEYLWRRNPAIRVQFFNENPEECLKSMYEDNILTDGMSLVRFLRDIRGLSHKVVYQVIQKPISYGLPPDIFTNTIKTLDLDGKTIVEALRSFGETFGTLFNQQGQEMALSALSEKYLSSNVPHVDMFESADQIFSILYSIVMLNTDAHNPQVQKKMTN